MVKSKREVKRGEREKGEEVERRREGEGER